MPSAWRRRRRRRHRPRRRLGRRPARRPASRVGALLGCPGSPGSPAASSPAPVPPPRCARPPPPRLPDRSSARMEPRGTVTVAYATAAVRSVGPQRHVDDRRRRRSSPSPRPSVFVPTLGRTRRALLPALGAALAFAAMLAFAAAQRLAGWDFDGRGRLDLRHRRPRRRRHPRRRPRPRPLGRRRRERPRRRPRRPDRHRGDCEARSAARSAIAPSPSATGRREGRCYVDESGATLDVDAAPGRVGDADRAGRSTARRVGARRGRPRRPRTRRIRHRSRPTGGVERPAAAHHERIEQLAASRRRILDSRRRPAGSTRTRAA